MTGREQSLALLLHDAIRFNPGPITEIVAEIIADGLRLIALREVTEDTTRTIMQRLLDQRMYLTAPFDPNVLANLQKENNG